MKADADYWKGFWTGRAIAVRLAALKPEPQWYLYNGMRLPKLPELTEEQKKQYPYAIIQRKGGTKYPWWELHFTNKWIIIPRDGSAGVILLIGCDKCLTYTVDLDDEGNMPTQWYYQGEYTIGASVSVYDDWDVWSNTDAIGSDGTVYFEASDPIPTT